MGLTREALRRALAGAVVWAACLGAAEGQAAIVYPPQAASQEKLAASEVRRYVYLRTGKLLPVAREPARGPEGLAGGGDAVVIARKDRPIVAKLATGASLKKAVEALGPQQYLLKTLSAGGRRILMVVGGDDVGTLYGAYRLAERLGVRFFMHGDVIPDTQAAWKLPDLDETGKPLFELRGVNPWGSHPFGFDQWSADDYKTHIGQLAKMRMNFIGMHCYPEGHPYAEPTVWLGLAGEFDDRGRVKTGYPSRYYNTLWRGRWGPIPPKKTSAYSFGGSVLFARDDWGPDVMADLCPTPSTPKGCNELFNRTGEQFRKAFTFARLVGVKTCVGTEAPMIMPKALRDRLAAKGRNPGDPAVVQEVYEGIFRRIMKTHPLDYYWIWTPEGWTWRGNTDKQMSATMAEIKIALAAMKKVGAPFKLATSGWVLGPKDDRAAFDKLLPKEISVSAISRTIGHTPVDPAFARVTGREKWAIPWMEGDGRNGLAAVQLWASRTRKDAADALAYGCTGLMGLQWRTRILAPNIAVLAQAGWDQKPWNPDATKAAAPKPPAPPKAEGPLGGNVANYAGQAIAKTDDDPLYRSCRYNFAGYRLKVPNGTYRVTLKFCEPHFDAAGKRIGDFKLQGKTVIEKLDIFARVGKFAALDLTFPDVKVADGWLRIDIVARVSLPCISGVAVEGKGFARKINCGGPAYKDYKADAPAAPARRGQSRGLPVDDFYGDWAHTLFGAEVAKDAAAIFTRIDGRVPQSVGGGCPSGSLPPDGRPWPQIAPAYAFVDELAALRPRVKGAGNLERFDYWLNTFRYHRGLHRVRCALGRFGATMKKVSAERDPAKRKALAGKLALPAYKNVLASYGQTYGYLLATVSTNGGLASVVNLESHAQYWPVVIARPAAALAKVLGGSLPADAQPAKTYRGQPRLILPTVRTSIARGQVLTLKVIVLSAERPRQAALYWREMGVGKFNRVPLRHVARGVHTVAFPPDGARSGVEYYVQATVGSRTLRFPATAPTINQTLVLYTMDSKS